MKKPKRLRSGDCVKINHPSWGPDNGRRGKFVVEEGLHFIRFRNGEMLGIDPSHLTKTNARNK